MADNKTADAGSGGATFATLQGTWSGDTADVAAAAIIGASGSEGSWTFAAIPGDATDGLLVNLGGNNDITGTVTANLGATDNAVLDAIQAAVEGTLTVGSHAVTNAGTFAVQVDGDALTALQLIDDSIFADDAAFTLASSKVTVAGAVRDDALSTLTAIEGDAVPLRVGSTGALHVNETNSAAILADTANMDTNIASLVTQTTNLQNCIIQDDAPFTPATGYLMMIGGEYDDAGTDSVDEGDAGNVRITANRSFHTVIRDNAGNERGLNVDANGEIGVTLANTSLPAGTNAIGKLVANSGVDIGDVDVLSIAAGSNLIGDVGISGARTSGGTTLYRNVDVDETEDQVKATAGQVYWIQATNLDATPVYLQFYNATAASVTVGSTTPDLTFCVPSQGDANGAGFVLAVPNGIAFSTAITIAATTTAGGAGGPGANEVIVNLGYA